MEKIIFIAEIGINHNGDLNIAKNLIDNSKKAGFDLVKFQKRDVLKVYSKEILDTPRKSPWGTTTREQKFGLEFEKKQYDEIDAYCKKINIGWFASAWDLKSLDFLDSYDMKYYKIPSAMIVDKNFLKSVAKKGKYTFISTGMSSLDDIDAAVKIFKFEGCKFEIMHCVSTYPMRVELANLLTINALKKRYNCKVGYSGHESGLAVSYAASMLGISSLERHVTLDRSMTGSDHSTSLEMKGMTDLISVIKKMQCALGTNKIGHIFDEEIPIAKKLRAHIKN
jgi:N-acetylneuraminate synthase